MPSTSADLPVFPHHHYGANVSDIGEDGDWVGHGHIDHRRFIAACNRANREDAGIPSLLEDHPWAESYVDLRSMVRHVWAVRDKDNDLAPYPEEWCISWDGVTAGTPGAFPVTLGFWS